MTSFDQRMKRKMEGELVRVKRWIASLRREPRPEELESEGDNTPLSEETEAALVGEEKEIQFQLLDALTRRAKDLEAALQRIQHGLYGICVRCDRSIHHERLEALPEAALCLTCQDFAERDRRAHGSPTPDWLEAATLLKERSDFE